MLVLRDQIFQSWTTEVEFGAAQVEAEGVQHALQFLEADIGNATVFERIEPGPAQPAASGRLG